MTLEMLMDRYGAFEQQVRRQMEAHCRPVCATCRRVCCRPHFCVESHQAPFLAGVIDRITPHLPYNDIRGWLGDKGCRLVAGRPPVCYEYLCREIPDTASGNFVRRHALLALSMLVSFVGRRALGARHLVEISAVSNLQQIDTNRVMARIRSAETVLEAAVAALNGEFVADPTERFSLVAAPPPNP